MGGVQCCLVTLPEEIQGCAYMRDVQPWHSGDNQLAICAAPCPGIGYGDWLRQVRVSVVAGSLRRLE